MATYCYVAVDQATGKPVAGGDNKYHLRHKLEAKVLDANSVKFYRIRERTFRNGSYENDVVVELSLDEVMKQD